MPPSDANMIVYPTCHRLTRTHCASGKMPVALLLPAADAAAALDDAGASAVVVLVSDATLDATLGSSAATALAAAGFAVLVFEPLLAGTATAPAVPGDREAACFTHCYNCEHDCTNLPHTNTAITVLACRRLTRHHRSASLFAKRVADVVATIELASQLSFAAGGRAQCHLCGLGGTAAALATAACVKANGLQQSEPPVAALAVDTQGFRFERDVGSIYDANFLPGAVKYGDLPALLELTAPPPLWLAGEPSQNNHLTVMMQRTKVAMPPPFRATGHASVVRQFFGSDGQLDDIVEWLRNVGRSWPYDVAKM